ncbi:MAG TPA: ATP-dependent Clp protease ATP-binding subunit ClpC, partial [Terriglobia bacterium]|nr:ATP-dependent Clp protease ATP-binding subunit ClpC [Terriglobia bacterium]
ARYLEKRNHLGFQSANMELSDKKVEAMVMAEVKRLFNPEFLNRLDEVIIFNALTDDDLMQIIDLLAANINANLAQKNISISLSQEAARWILEKTCADRSYGARPLRRALQKHLEDPLSEALIQGEIQAPAVLEVIVGNEGLYYRPVNDTLVTATPLSH